MILRRSTDFLDSARSPHRITLNKRIIHMYVYPREVLWGRRRRAPYIFHIHGKRVGNFDEGRAARASSKFILLQKGSEFILLQKDRGLHSLRESH